MLRKSLALMLLVSMAVAFYTSALTCVVLDEETALVTLDVCSDELSAGHIAVPTVPEPVFSFALNSTFDTISCQECLLFAYQYPVVLERPPVA